MEYMEAPIPATSMTETGEDNVKEGKKFFISKDSDVYVLICSKTNTHLILNLKLSNKILYESILNKNNLNKNYSMLNIQRTNTRILNKQRTDLESYPNTTRKPRGKGKRKYDLDVVKIVDWRD